MFAEEGDTPRALLDRPEIEPQLLPFWEAWHELSTDRHADGMGAVGSIPFTAIDCYASRHGIIDADEFERLRSLVRVMDHEYLDRIERKRREAEQKKK